MLLLINGLPGTGKSTLARRWVDDHPLTLALDIDVVLAQLGRWSEHQDVSWLTARRLALAMARQHLLDGSDVVVPQFVGRIDFVHELEQLAAETSATFRHLVLRAPSAGEAARRFRERGANPETEQHANALLGLPEGGSEAEFATFLAGLEDVLEARPETLVIDPLFGDVDGTYAALADALARARN